jgi:hypothetical protein
VCVVKGSVLLTVSAKRTGENRKCVRFGGHGLLAATHMALRSTATNDIIAWIDTMRTDPKMNCPDFCKLLMLDKAGEWLKESPFFLQQCTDRHGLHS